MKSPSQSQISALNRLLEAVFHEHGLCPVKELPIRQEVAKDVSKTIHVLHPGTVHVINFFVDTSCSI